MPRESLHNDDTIPDEEWYKSITSIMDNADDEARQVKKIRKLVLLSLQLDDNDKGAKKQYKKAIQDMEKSGVLKLDGDGAIHMLQKTGSTSNNKKRRESTQSKDEKRKSKKEKKQKKQKIDTDEENNIDDHQIEDDDGDGKPHESIEDPDHDGNSDAKSNEKDKNKPCKGNPQGVTRLFLGNLPFAVDEASLSSFLPGQVTHIKWITDKETGKFYGSAFCEMDNSKSAAEAVAMTGSKLIGRPIKINLAPARDGDVWPPAKKVVSGNGGASSGAGSTSTGGGGQAGGSGIKAMSAKPDNCTKLFIGNLSYDIDDETITKFFANVDAEVKAVRWIHHKDSGDFKGVGFVEFWSSEACEKAATLNGKNLLGRPIRIDWTD